MTYKLGTVKLFAFPFEIDTPNIISCAPQFFSCAPKISAVPKNLHLVVQVLPNSNLNFESGTALFQVPTLEFENDARNVCTGTPCAQHFC